MVEYRNTANRETLEDTKKRGFGLVSNMDLSASNAPALVKSGPTSVAAINQAQQTPTTAPAPLPQNTAFNAGSPAAAKSGFGLDRMAAESAARLRELGVKSQTPREWTTPMGNKVSTVNKNYSAAIEAEKAISDLVSAMYGQESAKELGAARVKLGVERNELLKKGQEETLKMQGRDLLQRDISAGKDREQKAQELFEKQLIDRSPKSDETKAANTGIGMFRMALAGETIPDKYKAQVDELGTQFNQFWRSHTDIPDTAEGRKIAIQQFEKMLAGEEY